MYPGRLEGEFFKCVVEGCEFATKTKRYLKSHMAGKHRDESTAMELDQL